MTSPLLALFTRSLREDTRAKGTYWARAGLVAFVLLLLVGMSGVNYEAPGLDVFSKLVYLQLVAITLVGLSWFASAITEEKEEETLGLLRMTKLNPLSILLGKSTSRLCGALLLLIAPLPFTLLAITFGGVSLGQILAAYCTLGAYTFFLCNLALLFSVLTRNTTQAAFATFAALLLFFFNGVLLLIRFNHGPPSPQKEFAFALLNATPVMRLAVILRTGFAEPPAGWQVVSNLALGVACFAGAWALFTRFAEDTPVEVSPAKMEEQVLMEATRIRAPRPWKNALAWKDFYFLHGGLRGVPLRVLIYFAGAVTIGTVIGEIFDEENFLTFAYAALLLELAIVAASIFRVELRDQTWSSLVLLPFSIRQIVWRKLGGAALILIPAGASVLIALGALLLKSHRNPPSSAWDEFELWLMLANLLTFTALALCCTYLIAFLSLVMKRGALAFGLIIFSAVWMAIDALDSITANAVPPRLCGFGIYLVAVLFLHRAVLRRVEALAAEG